MSSNTDNTSTGTNYKPKPKTLPVMGYNQTMPTLATNKKAHQEYEILKTLEVGISLRGPEVKSAKTGHARITESFARFDQNGHLTLMNAYFGPYDKASPLDQHEAYRVRDLLIKKSEAEDLMADTAGKNLTIVPLRMYTVRQGLIKVEIGLARGKKQYDKRKTLKERDVKREIDRTLKKYTY